MADDNSFIKKRFLYQLAVPITFVVLMWVAHIINLMSHGYFRTFGIYPRSLEGIIGIFTAPFVHGDIRHLISNSLPIFFLLTMLFVLYRRIAWQTFFLLYLLTGVFVWFFARPAYHIGASGIVYALVSFLFWSGVFRRNIRAIGIALAVLVLYSGYFLGILPNQPGVSWESHLMGGISGIIVSYMYKDVLEKDEIQSDEPIPLEEKKNQYFVDDTFVFTKAERKFMRKNKDDEDEDDNDWFSTSTL